MRLGCGNLVLCEVFDDGEQRAPRRGNVGRCDAANGDLVYNLRERDELGFHHHVQIRSFEGVVPKVTNRRTLMVSGPPAASMPNDGGERAA